MAMMKTPIEVLAVLCDDRDYLAIARVTGRSVKLVGEI
jgi:hypothetical protein